MKTKEFIAYAESTLRFDHLRACYNDDCTRKSFKGWFIAYLIDSEGLSPYVAKKVAEHFRKEISE